MSVQFSHGKFCIVNNKNGVWCEWFSSKLTIAIMKVALKNGFTANEHEWPPIAPVALLVGSFANVRAVKTSNAFLL